MASILCPVCLGDERPCPRCNGTGVVDPEDRSFDPNMPAWVELDITLGELRLAEPRREG